MSGIPGAAAPIRGFDVITHVASSLGRLVQVDHPLRLGAQVIQEVGLPAHAVPHRTRAGCNQ